MSPYDGDSRRRDRDQRLAEAPWRPFVVLRHAADDDVHFDLLLRSGDTLLTWSCPTAPAQQPSLDVARRPDHRLVYLHYRGALSRRRGVVHAWDVGWCRADLDELDQGRAIVQFRGRRLRGLRWLRRVAGDRWALAAVTPEEDA